jgi:hypothetical protein
MGKRSVWLILSAVMVLLLVAVQIPFERISAEDVEFGEYTITGPYTHDNLSVFLIRGENKVEGREFLTLEEALDRKVAVLHETEDVGELMIDNNDSKIYIYIQQGDIVKGGKQDRTLSFDVLVPPKTRKFRIKSFCVEQGRWSQRGGESAAFFSVSDNQVAGNDLKLAANAFIGGQAVVWDNVKVLQDKLAANAAVEIKELDSQTSLQLTLEDSKVKDTSEAYVKALSRATRGRRDVVGFAFAINGKVQSANIYASNLLSRKLWPKLLESSAVEAVAEMKRNKKFRPVAGKDVKTWLENAEKGAATAKAINEKVKMVKQETDASYIFQTDADGDADVEWYHRNYVAK